MARPKQAPSNDPSTRMVSQRLRNADIEQLKALGERAQMPWGEVLRRVVEMALPHVTAGPGGVTFNCGGGRMK